MKRINHLFELVTDRQNLYLAWLKAIKGKRKAAEVIRFQREFAANMAAVRERLGTANPGWGNYRTFRVRDPKPRVISAAPLPERIMQHAIMNVLDPVFDRRQVFHSYACRKGKGTQAAVLHAFRQTKKFGFFLKLDVRRYFDSVAHEVLIRQIDKIIKDEMIMFLFRGIIDSHTTSPGHGLPIGNLTSQYFANHYLAGLDHYVLEQLKPGSYVRYMDDMVVWADDPEHLRRIFEAIRAYCAQELALALKPPVMGAVNIGVPFLGFLLKPSGIFLLNRSKRRMRKRAKAIEDDLVSGRIDEDLAAMRATSVNAAVKVARTRGFRVKLWRENRHGLERGQTWRQLEQHSWQRYRGLS